MGEGDHREPAWGGDQEPVHGDARGAGGFLHPVSCSSGSQDWSHETDGGLGQQNPSVTQAGGDGCDGEEETTWLWGLSGCGMHCRPLTPLSFWVFPRERPRDK